MDNTGPYVTYEDIIVELYEGKSTTVTNAALTLANRTADAAGDLFDYSAGTPQVGDIIYQGGYYERIIEIVSATQLRIATAGGNSTVANGPSTLLHGASPVVNRRKIEDLIKQSMQVIDRATRQFFNKRTGTFKIEGNNTPVLFLNVPIIEITKLTINSDAQVLYEGELKDFVAFKGRQAPQDDRWNPKINLNIGRGRDSIFARPLTNRVFCKGTLTEIQGSFGFLEEDGSTPSQIQLATKLLVIEQINNPIADTETAETGPLRRTRVDLHEKEFFDPRPVSQSSTKASETGNAKVDRIIAKYRTPMMITGSISFLPGAYARTYYP